MGTGWLSRLLPWRFHANIAIPDHPTVSFPVRLQPLHQGIRRFFQKNGALLLMATPGVVILFVFSYLPMVGLIIAFKDYLGYQGIFGSAWVGLQNFHFVFGTPDAIQSMLNTLVLNGIFIITTLIAALGIAFLLNEIRDRNQTFAKFYHKYGLDLSSVNSFADLTSFFAKVKVGEPGVTPLYTSDNVNNSVTFHPESAGWDPLTSSLPLAIKETDASLQVFNEADQPEFQQLTEQMYQWAQAGYTTKTPSAAADQNALFKSGKYAALITVVKPGGDASSAESYGNTWESKSVTTPLLDTDAAVATLNGVCASSPNPDKAVQILNLLNTNKDLYNLISHGIAGKNYIVTDKTNGVITPTASNNGYNPSTDWMFGNQFNAYYTDATQVGSWDATKQLNQSATISTALGFAFDTTPVKTQVAQVTAAITQYGGPLFNGQVDPATGIPAYQKALQQAGIDEIKAEMQKQITAWAKANGK